MHVYVIQRQDGLVKIGRSKQPTKRLSNLQTQGGFSPESVWFSSPVADACDVERRAHATLKASRTIGEWFEVSFEDAVQGVIAAINSPALINEEKETRAFDLKTMAGRLHSARIALDWTQHDLAKAAGISRDIIAKSELGVTKLPREVETIATALGTSPAWLAFGIGPVSADAQQGATILDSLTPPQRAQAIRMLEAYAASVRETN